MRLAHAVIVFPGGVGTVEEIFYLLSILLHPENRYSLPVIFAGPESCRPYFDLLDGFIGKCLGEEATQLYDIVLGRPDDVARRTRDCIDDVHRRRRKEQEAYYFNWNLHIDPMLQVPFVPTHDNMASLRLYPDLPGHELASQLRSAFSGLVAGNVKEFGIRQVEEHGPYQIAGDPRLMEAIDELLRSFVAHKRMKLGQGVGEYQPCYQLTG